MKILSIETSCDESAVSIVDYSLENNQPQIHVLVDLVISQIETHAEYGGVFPALAKREHKKNLPLLITHALEKINSNNNKEQELSQEKRDALTHIFEREPELVPIFQKLYEDFGTPDIQAIIVTHGPGLAPALWVGVNIARALSVLWNIPIIPTNHMEGHITSILLQPNYLEKPKALVQLDQVKLPIIALLISGGHTQLVLVRDWCDYEIIGETIDDAVGEAFDKVARMLGMEYPGGPKVSKAAQQGQENEHIRLPRPMLHSGDYRFSFSGLKTAVRYLVEDLKTQDNFNEQIISDVAREFEHSVTEVLVKKTLKAIDEYGAQGLIIAGGVSANKYITESFQKECDNYGIPLYLPDRAMCGDNSLMIAVAGIINYWKHGEQVFVDQEHVSAIGNLKL